jgi:hypothetical protein
VRHHPALPENNWRNRRRPPQAKARRPYWTAGLEPAECRGLESVPRWHQESGTGGNPEKFRSTQEEPAAPEAIGGGGPAGALMRQENAGASRAVLFLFRKLIARVF